jgi:hypothetical protein
MRWVVQEVWKPVRRRLSGAGIFVFLLTTVARGQNSQFFFDAAGNFLVQTAESGVPPQIIGQPQSQIVAPGENTSFSVVVADTRGVTYQWLFGSTPITGASGDTVLLAGIGPTNEGQDSVVAANGFGSVTSTPAMLWFDGNGNGLPDSWEVAHFGNVNQSATGDFDGDGVSNLDEFLEGTDPADPHSYHPRLHILSLGSGIAFTTPPLPYFNLGQVVTITAVPDPLTSFLGWTGAATGIKPQISVLMNGHKTVSALFGQPMPPPAFQSISAGGGSVSLTWSTVPGRSYQLQFKTDLTQGTWSNLGGPVTASDWTISFTDSSAADTQRLYRVGILP